MKKFPFKLVTILIITVFSSNISLSAEGINKPFKKAPVVKEQQTAAMSEETLKTAVLDQTNKSSQTISGNKMSSSNMIDTSSKQSPFVKSVIVMIKALFAILILIGSLFGGMVIYQWLKNNAAKNQPKQPQPTNSELKPPETISDAVASFVKHRIKK